MQRALLLGFVGVVSLGLGCASAGPGAPDRQTVGEESPEVVSDPASGKKQGGATPAPTVIQEQGAPVPYPGAAPSTASTVPAPPKVKSKMTFFVTSTGTAALGGNLGGLAGADGKCQELGSAAAGNDHTWHAYVSVTGTNAKDRIGPGPWVNQKGDTVATNVEALHDLLFSPPNSLMIDEKGAAIPPTATSILTGTKSDGTALLQNCNDWTSATAQQQARVGDAASQTNVVLGVRWNDAIKSNGCSADQIKQNKGEGRLYCFAID